MRSDQAAQGFTESGLKTPRMDTAQMLWGPIPLLNCAEGEICFSLYPVWMSYISSYAHCLLALSSCHGWLSRMRLCLISDLSLAGPPQSFSLLQAEKPFSNFFTQDKDSSPQASWWPPAKHTPVHWCLSHAGNLELDILLKTMNLVYSSIKEQHLCLSLPTSLRPFLSAFCSTYFITVHSL